MVLSFDQAGELLDEMYEEFPEVLFRELNGGVCLLPDTRTDPDLPGEPTYIMGEYCTEPLLGCFINLYYGSFAALAAEENWSEEDWEEELAITLSHELTHHVEGLAGLRDLDLRDAMEMEEWREQEQSS